MLSGTARARHLLEGVPNRFYDFSRMDQFTFVQLADWCIENTEMVLGENVSVEESLLIFLDIVGQGSSFKLAAATWGHDEEFIRKIFVEVLGALRVLKERDEVSQSCPKFGSTKSKWRVLKSWRPSRIAEGYVQVGEDRGGGIEVKQEEIIEALTALNNFIHEHKE